MGFLVLDEDFQHQTGAAIANFFSRPQDFRGRLQHKITLPLLTNPPKTPLACRETAEETAHVSAHVEERIRDLYGQLADHGLTRDAAAAMSLELQIQSQSFDIYPACDHRRYHARRLSLQMSGPPLPQLPFVERLRLESAPSYLGNHSEDYDTRPLSLLVPLQLAASLPRLTTLILPWLWERPLQYAHPSAPVREHYTRPWEGPLRDARHEFGSAILDQEKYLGSRRIPGTLKNALLHFWVVQQTPVEDQTLQRPNLILPGSPHETSDPLSVGLCELARQLERLDLRAMITEDLFPTPSRSGQDKQWSSMQRLRVEFHPLRPDGRWYFLGPRGEDDEQGYDGGGYEISRERDYPREHDDVQDEAVDAEYEESPDGGCEVDILPDMFRTEPCRERIEPLLARFARAVGPESAPNMRDAELFAYVWWSPSENREVEYQDEQPYKMGTAHRWGVKYERRTMAGIAVLKWQVGDWRPSAEVMALFEALGEQEWLEFEHSKGRPMPTAETRMNIQLFDY